MSEYTAIRDDILSKYSESLNKLKERYLQSDNNIVGFDDTKIQYVQYLIAYVVGQRMGCKICPPLNVDIIWRIHLHELGSYFDLSNEIINQVYGKTTLKECSDGRIKVILYSEEEERKKNRDELLKNMKDFYKVVLSFDPFDCDDYIMDETERLKLAENKRKVSEDSMPLAEVKTEKEEQQNSDENKNATSRVIPREDGESTHSEQKRKRGRPRKTPVPDSDAPKEKRGRPRKTPVKEAEDSMPLAEVKAEKEPDENKNTFTSLLMSKGKPRRGKKN